MPRVCLPCVRLLLLATATFATAGPANPTSPNPASPTLTCPARPTGGSLVDDPRELHSAHGVLQVDLSYRKSPGADGAMHFCYVSSDGSEAPTLRMQRGDLLILRVKNDEPPAAASSAPMAAHHVHAAAPGACSKGSMNASTTNVHFHGLTVPPVCHQDDVLTTVIQPGDPPYEYRLRIPADEPPGLYWYHPHIHGLTKSQVLGGASGALIIGGIERANAALAGIAERVFVIRDQDLVNPDATPQKTDSMPAPMVTRDADGEILNTGTDGGVPAKDLSINFVPVAFPSYRPAVIKLRPAERQLWRILNASAITYLDLQLLVGDRLQALGVVALDGVPINADGNAERRVLWQSHALVPPGGRIEMLVRGPPTGSHASFVTRRVDTGPAGENDPTRPLATVVADAGAAEPAARLDAAPQPLAPARTAWLGNAVPVRTRTLYFSEKPHDPQSPTSATDFFITVDGQQPRVFDPNSNTPDIVVHQGDVEDWIIENRTLELHAFHIHQLHFMLVEWNGIPLDEPFLRDTVNVAYWDGKSSEYPRVKLRMDFRDPNTIGTFPYHCHLLEHEDGGMMGLIRVERPTRSAE